MLMAVSCAGFDNLLVSCQHFLFMLHCYLMFMQCFCCLFHLQPVVVLLVYVSIGYVFEFCNLCFVFSSFILALLTRKMSKSIFFDTLYTAFSNRICVLIILFCVAFVLCSLFECL